MEEKKVYLSISEMLSRAFNLCKNSALEILKVIGIFIVPTIVVLVGIIVGIVLSSLINISYSYSYSYSYFDEAIPLIGIGTILLIILVALVSSLLMLYASGIITKVLDDANKGNEVSWRAANKYVWQRKWSILGLNVLVWLMLFAFAVVIILLTILLAVLTVGIGLIILIPLIIAIAVVMAPLAYLFNSMLIVRDLTITEAIGETFMLFKKGYFWSTIGKLAAISGITIGIGLVLAIIQIIPLVGIIIAVIGQYAIQAYTISYLNILALDRSNTVESFIDPIM
ncbi:MULTISPECIES: hypothetical protein [unclassified Clostridium]|uniref:hypothetical protein n=1 Tax=unclassified Clostridium TaxID=2614128 RepID=UPI00189A3BC8|nr:MULTISPECIES: hypothetical protein [unclassified Clostridium]MCR1953074.1 hypothetical protein [Clostridium sp. DSM 100503]